MKKIWNQYSYAIILILLSCSIAFMLSIRFNTNEADSFMKVTVSEGDSLWGISEKFSDQHTLSHNDFVKWVKMTNNIQGDQIYPGEEIIVPLNGEAVFPKELASAAGE